MGTVKLKINGKEITVDNSLTVYQACRLAGIEIPTFCYHPKLTIAGNCLMCLVELSTAPKPIASCAMPVMEGMEIATQSPRIKEAQKAVLKFLLINHPLDCPICDQGGECDLQDLTMAYGPGTSRFKENKRSVPEKNFGPLIKTVMTRCIHCTRCVRFAQEVAGVSELGGLYRGENTEISTVLNEAVTSELSGNMIDICPVGALTSKPYAFEYRSWELEHTDSIGIHDAVGSHIRIDTMGREVRRILPRQNDDINEDWICDKTRFACDGLRRQRLDRPYVREQGRLTAVSWAHALASASHLLKSTAAETVGFLVGDLLDLESMYALKGLANAIKGTHIDCRQVPEFLPVKERADYLFNTTIAAIEKADACLIVGSNPRYEASLINARLRKAYLHHDLPVGVVGPAANLTYPYDHIGENLNVIQDLIEGKHAFSKILKKAKKPMIIVGTAVLRHERGAALYALIQQLAKTYNVVQTQWSGFNVLALHASQVGARDLNCYPARGKSLIERLQAGAIKVLYALGADDLAPELLEGVRLIYQGHHGDRMAQAADVILPGAAYSEKNGLYVNTEGRVQQGVRSLFPVGEAKEDWRVIKALGKELDISLPYNTQEELREHLYAHYPHLQETFTGQKACRHGLYELSHLPQTTTVDLPIENFYMTDVICRASETMAKCVQEFGKIDEERMGTHG